MIFYRNPNKYKRKYTSIIEVKVAKAFELIPVTLNNIKVKLHNKLHKQVVIRAILWSIGKVKGESVRTGRCLISVSQALPVQIFNYTGGGQTKVAIIENIV